ncbi:MAG: helix-turn-helix transcriptional regulator [Lentisphaeria bacterium]|nr:helix-turn-helix transcriptional regulator [Lentisphaeria bacterium]
MENSCELIKNAVRCFEQWSRTSVTIYTFQSAYWYLFSEYCMHPQKPCQAIKKKHLQKCVTFDKKQLRDEILILRAGYLKICPGGFLEWCVPVQVDHTVIGIVLAGLRTPPAVLPAEYPVIDSRYRVPETKIHAVPQTDDAEIHLVMEGLKQLGARIEQILASENIIHDTADIPRATQIRLIIQKNLAEDYTLAMLSEYLHLSASRTSHLIRELTGCTFQQLLTRYRMEYAAYLLKHSESDMTEVATRCGYHYVTHFHAVFKKYYGMTPLEYKRSLSASNPV